MKGVRIEDPEGLSKVPLTTDGLVRYLGQQVAGYLERYNCYPNILLISDRWLFCLYPVFKEEFPKLTGGEYNKLLSRGLLQWNQMRLIPTTIQDVACPVLA